MLALLRRPVVVAAGVPTPSFLFRSLSNAFVFNGVTTSRLKEASFTIEDGAKVCLTGSSDKAKIDILKLIEGNLDPISGTIEKENKKKYLSFQPHVPKQFYGLSVERYLAQQVPGGVKGDRNTDTVTATDTDTSIGESVVQEALDDASIRTSSRTNLVSELSTSEKSRLQLAVALVQAPDVLLLDNPTKIKNGVLSDNDIKKVIEFILKFPNTCVVNSSDPDFLNSFADHVLHVSDEGYVEMFVGSFTSAQNMLTQRSTAGEEEVTSSDVRFGLFLLFLLCPFEAMLFFYYQ